MTLADLLRLVAVPVLGWAAYRDVAVRRVPTRTWYPLVALGVVLLAVDAWRVFGGDGLAVGPYVRRRFLVAVVVSLVVVVPFSYLVWRLGGFGGADAKALMALAVLFPTYPSYRLVGAVLLPLPEGRTAVGAFSLTILTNTVLLAACYPFALAAWNLLSGELSPVMLFGRRVPAGSVVERHGSLLETPDGYTRRGLDVDALRMYLRWRDTTLAAVREDPGAFRDPASVPAEGNDPGDGAIDQRPVDAGEEHATDGGADEVPDETAGAVQNGEVAGEPEADAPERLPNGAAPDDEWGAAAFLDDVGWGAYGTSPEDLRDGLEVLATRETVWYSPGIPFIVPMFVGLLVALTLGDLLFYALSWLGVA